MGKIGYLSLGGIGSLVGVNIAAMIMGYQAQTQWLASNHIGEAVLVFSILGIFYDLLPAKIKLNAFLVVPLAFLVGAIWEPFSFLAGFNWIAAKEVLVAWIIFGGPTIFIIGTPTIFISLFMRSEKIVWGLDSVGITGRAMNFIFCMITAMVLLILMFHFNIFGLWAGLFGIVI